MDKEKKKSLFELTTKLWDLEYGWIVATAEEVYPFQKKDDLLKFVERFEEGEYRIFTLLDFMDYATKLIAE